MRRIVLKIAYDGTGYAGWQRQDNGTAVQAVIEDTIERLFSEKVHVMGSGRTDAGVHARGQIAAVDLQHNIPAGNLLMALNANLPEDIRILAAAEGPEDFHPQYHAKKKTYVYRFYNGKVMPPELRIFTDHVAETLDEEAMQRSIKALEGEHDFYAFRSAKAVNASTVRTIYRAELKKVAMDGSLMNGGSLYELRITGNGFLYNMVRIIAGTVIDIGRGRIDEGAIEKALESLDRSILGLTAPAKGLTLESVEYEGIQL